MSNCHCGNCIYHWANRFKNGRTEVKCKRDGRYHEENDNCKKRCDVIVSEEHPRDWEKRADDILSKESDRSKQKIYIWLTVIWFIIIQRLIFVLKRLWPH